MSSLFITILNMSLTASYVVLAVIVARLLLKKTPKIFSYVLWSVVLFRLLFPFSFESNLSLIPIKSVTISQEIVYSQNPAINSGVDRFDNIVNNTIIPTLPAVNPAASVNPMGIIIEAATIVWIIGIIILLSYGILSYLKLRKSLLTATLMKDNLYETDIIQSPFVLGFIKPKIYIPIGLNEKELNYILLHERTHIKRRDYLIKPIAYLALILHWFNPMIWLSYILMTKDMEMSCDESVMEQSSEDIRESYSKSLLSLSIKHSRLVSPLAFGESNIKSRIKNVLNYKKPTFWISALGLMVVIILVISLISNNTTQDIPKDNIFSETPFKGLELYVWKNKELTGNDETYFTLLIGTNRNKEEHEIYDLDIAVDSIEELNQLLAIYSNESQLFIYQMNTVDFTKTEMSIIADKINFPVGNGVKTIGLWQNRPLNENDIPDNVSILVEQNLEIIMSSPLYSSRPLDYIYDHQNEYENIIKLGDDALNYLLSQFEKGNSNGLRGHIMMLLCKEILGERNNVKDEMLLPQEWYNALSIIKETKLPDFKYTGDNLIEKLVYATEIEQNKNPYRGGFIIVAPKIHAYYEEGNKLKVFVTTYYSSYHLHDKVLTLDSGGVVPAAITYTKDGKGEYILEKYQQAMDGSYFSKSIKDFCTMPVSGKKIDGLADKILNHYGEYNDVITLQRENLIRHLNAYNQNGVILKTPNGELIPLT